MISTRIFRTRNVVALVLILILMALVSAFAAANTVDPSNAGDGAGAISGYTVTNIDYTLDATNPRNIEQVDFTMAGVSAPSTVRIQLVDGSATWYDCDESGYPAISCTTTGPV